MLVVSLFLILFGFDRIDLLLVKVGKRLMRVAYSRSIVDHPMIPVDTVANMVVAVAWFTAINNNL